MKPHKASMERNILSSNPDITPSDDTVPNEAPRNELRGIDGDGKTNPLRRPNDRRIHADDLATGGDQRPSGIARVQCGIRLNEVIDQSSGPRSERSTQRADYPRRDRALEAVGIADGYDQLADADRSGVAQLHRGELRGIDAN